MKGQSFLKVCSIILILAGVFMLAAGGLGFTKILEAKDRKTSEKLDGLALMDQLAAGEKQLAENEEAYNEGKVAFEEGQVTLVTGKGTLAQGYKDYEEGKATLAQGYKDYNEGLATYQEGNAAYQAGLTTYNQKYQEYLAGKAQYEEGKAQLAANTEAYNTAKNLMASDTVQKALAALAKGEMITPSVQAIIDTANNGIKTYEDGQKTLAAAEIKLADAEKQLADARDQLDAARGKLSAGKTQLTEAQAKLSAGEQQLASAEGQLSAGEAKIAQGEVDLADGAAQLKVFEDGQETVAGALVTLNETSASDEYPEGEVQAILDENPGLSISDAGRTYITNVGMISEDPETAGKIFDVEGHTSQEEITTTDLMSRLYSYLIAMVAGILAIIAGIIGWGAATTPSVGKIKGAIFTGLGTVVLALVANVYHGIVISQHTLNLVNGQNFTALEESTNGVFSHAAFEACGQISTAMQAGAIVVLGVAAILFVVAIIRFKNALLALLAGD